MAIVYQSFARGTLPTSKTALYTADAQSVASLWLLQTSETPQDVQIFINRSSGGSIKVCYLAAVPQNYKAELSNIVLASGDKIEAQTTTSSVVNYEITGAEIT
jgi:hypothetical protein